MIYFMQPTNGGPVKIGFTDVLDSRRRQLEKHYGCNLVVLATMPGGLEKEIEIHAQFSHIRLGGLGRRGRRPEQFRPTEELMKFIGRPLLASANPDAVEVMDQPKTVGIRATGEWAAWLERGARHCRTDVAKLLDYAVADYLKARGFNEPPPERIP